jgi:hypothetical protein
MGIVCSSLCGGSSTRRAGRVERSYSTTQETCRPRTYINSTLETMTAKTACIAPAVPVATCLKGHMLQAVGASCDNGWRCDAHVCKSGVIDFHQTLGMERFRCEACDFDVCRKCVKTPVEVATKGMTEQSAYARLMSEAHAVAATQQNPRPSIELSARTDTHQVIVHFMDPDPSQNEPDGVDEATKLTRPQRQRARRAAWRAKRAAEADVRCATVRVCC